jgi:hypothetical protein
LFPGILLESIAQVERSTTESRRLFKDDGGGAEKKLFTRPLRYAHRDQVAAGPTSFGKNGVDRDVSQCRPTWCWEPRGPLSWWPDSESDQQICEQIESEQAALSAGTALPHSANSGGPAFDLIGDVVGVNSAIFSPSGASVGIGFAIPPRR